MSVTRAARAGLQPLLALNAAWVGLSFMWNSLHVIVLPAVLLHFVPETQKNTYLGTLTFLGLVIAMVVQPVAGAASDGWRSRWGRRRPLILLGTLGDLPFLTVLAVAGGLPWLAAGYLGLQVTSNVAHGALQGLLPDQAPPEQLGRASSLKNLFDMAGLVAASLAAARLMTPDTAQPVLAMAVVAACLVGSTAVTLLGVREAPAPARSRAPGPSPWPSRRWTIRGPYAWLIGSRFAFLVGVYGIQGFAQYYVRDVLGAPDPAVLTGNLMAALTVTLLVFVVAGGWLCDRAGAARVQTAAAVVGAAGCLLLVGARTPGLLLACGSVLGAGIGLFLTANWTLANRLAPAGEAGRFLGLTNLATAGAGAASRLAGPMIDVVNNARPGAFWGYAALFVFAAVTVVVSLFLLRPVARAASPSTPAA